MAPVPMNATTRIPLEDWARNNPNNLKPNSKQLEELAKTTQFTKKQIRDYFVRQRKSLGITQAQLSKSSSSSNQQKPAVVAPPVSHQNGSQVLPIQCNVLQPMSQESFVCGTVPITTHESKLKPAVYQPNFASLIVPAAVHQKMHGKPNVFETVPVHFVYRIVPDHTGVYHPIAVETETYQALPCESVGHQTMNTEYQPISADFIPQSALMSTVNQTTYPESTSIISSVKETVPRGVPNASNDLTDEENELSGLDILNDLPPVQQRPLITRDSNMLSLPQLSQRHENFKENVNCHDNGVFLGTAEETKSFQTSVEAIEENLNETGYLNYY